MKPQPNTSYLYFDLGSDRKAFGDLRDRLVSLGADPKHPPIMRDALSRYVLWISIRLKSELETYLRNTLRLLDELDVEHCRVELRSVIAHMSADGTLTVGKRATETWNGLSTGWIASELDLSELHHTITAPKRGNRPPVALSDLPGASDAWLLVDPPGSWDFHWRKPSKTNADIASAFRRDREKIASLFKGADGLTVVSTLEQVVARWNSPFELADDSLYSISFRRLIGASDRWVPDFVELCAEIKRNHDQKFLSDEEMRTRTIGNLSPFRRIALAQGMTPLVIGLGLIPVIPDEKGLRFSDYFCTRGVSYGPTTDEAQALIDAFDELLFLLVCPIPKSRESCRRGLTTVAPDPQVKFSCLQPSCSCISA